MKLKDCCYFLLFYSFLLTYACIKEYNTYTISDTATITDCKFDHRSKDCTYYKIEFEYEVDGKLFKGTEMTSSGNLKVGNTIKILINSEKPEKFTFKNRKEIESSLNINLLGELLCILLIYQVLYGKLHSMLKEM